MRLPPNGHTAIDLLPRRRDIERGIAVEEIRRLERHADDLAGHDWKILRAGDMLDAELDPDDDVVIDDVVLAVGPGADAGPAAGLVGVFAAGVEFAVAVGGEVEVVVGELGAFVVVGVFVGEHFLEVRGVDLVGDRLSVDGVEGGGVLDLEGAGRGGGQVEALGGGDDVVGDGVADAVGVEIGAGHGVGGGGDEAVVVPVDGRVDAEGEDVLVVGGEDAGVDDGAPGDGDAGVDGLGADDAGGSDFVG